MKKNSTHSTACILLLRTCTSEAHAHTHTLLNIMSSTEPHGADLGRALCIITGASRGFGRTIARETSRLVKPGSVFVLVARSADELRALQAELAGSEAGRAGLAVECVVADLSQEEGLVSVVRASKQAFTEDMNHILLLNNAGKKNRLCRFMTKTACTHK